MKKFILSTVLAALALGTSAYAEEFAYYNQNTVCVYEELESDMAGKYVSVMLCDTATGLPAHAGECTVDEDGTYFYKFEFTVPEGKTLEDDYELRARVEDEGVKTFTLSEKPEDVKSFKVSVVDDALRNSTVKVKNLFEKESTYDFVGARKNGIGLLAGAKALSKKAFSYGWRGQSDEIEVPYVNNTEKLSTYIWDENMVPMSDANAHTGEIIGEFEDGDVVAIAGSSTIHLSTAPAMLEHFYQTRKPDENIRVINAGVGGDVIGGTIGSDVSYGVLYRLDWDVYHENPNKIFLACGGNDLLTTLYKEGDSEITGYKKIRFDSAVENYKNFVDTIKADNKELTCLGINYYDDADYEGGSESIFVGYKDAAEKLCAEFKKVSKDKDTVYLDMFGYGKEITEDHREDNPDAPVFFAEDRLHMTSGGYYAYGALLLIHQGVDSRVAETTIDALSSQVSTYNADVTVIEASDSRIKYEYAPKAIPMAVNSWYKDAENIIPVTDYLNQEIIKIDNLTSGNYCVEFTDTDNESYILGTYTADELAEGINIAINEDNPSQIQSQSAMVKQEQRFNYDMSHVRKTVQDSEERTTTGTMSEENLNALNEMKAISKGYSDEAKALSAPKQYTVVVEKVSAE